MLGIICAMEVEARLLANAMENAKSVRVSGIDYVTGTLDGLSAVLAVCGVGKVAAAVCTQTMILQFSPDFIINTGVGGSLDLRLNCGDIAVGKSVVQHDVDTTALGDSLGMVSGINKTYFECEKYNEIAETAGSLGKNCVVGVIASGDCFVANAEKRRFLHDAFSAIVCDMESGAIGQTCFLNDMPFCIVRAVSDNADGSSHTVYREFLSEAADLAASLIKKCVPLFKC